MSQDAFTLFSYVAWAAIAVGTLIKAYYRIARSQGSFGFKVWSALALITIFTMGNVLGFILWLAARYCENCSGKPVGFWEAIFLLTILMIPSAMALFLPIGKSSK